NLADRRPPEGRLQSTKQGGGERRQRSQFLRGRHVLPVPVCSVSGPGVSCWTQEVLLA
ncbi:hypothetical protein KUCAC02_014010, partial [Chaenocephalus aceratus]